MKQKEVEVDSSKTYKGAPKEKEANPRKTYTEAVKNTSKKEHNRINEKKTVTWFGTSVSKVLDQNKFEKDTNTNLKVVKAYCIQEEGKFPKENFCAIVPEELKTDPVDVAVFQTGSIEITNLDVKKAMMDPHRDIKEYEKNGQIKLKKILKIFLI